MRRASFYLAIVAYFTLVRRFITKTLYRFIARIKHRLGIISTHKTKGLRTLPVGYDLFYEGGNHLNIGMEQGFLYQFLRN